MSSKHVHRCWSIIGKNKISGPSLYSFQCEFTIAPFHFWMSKGVLNTIGCLKLNTNCSSAIDNSVSITSPLGTLITTYISYYILPWNILLFLPWDYETQSQTLKTGLIMKLLNCSFYFYYYVGQKKNKKDLFLSVYWGRAPLMQLQFTIIRLILCIHTCMCARMNN